MMMTQIGMKERIEEYLKNSLGVPLRLLSIKELGLGLEIESKREEEIKGFGYGKPYFVTFETSEGERKEVVISSLKGDSFGHEYPSDRAQILMWQYRAFNSLPEHVKALDVGYFTNDGRLISTRDAAEYFIVCEKVEGEEYVHDLDRLRGGARLREEDEARVSALASYLVDIHSRKGEDANLYIRRIRELLGHSECIFGLTDSYPSESEFITQAELKEIEKLCIEWRWKLKMKKDRLCMVHGDFHPWNVIFHTRTGTDFTLLDRSRGEWGEAADDVTAMTINYLFFGLMKTDGAVIDSDFKRLYELFFDVYLAKTKDYELLEVLQPFYAFRGLVVASPLWYPNISMATRKKLFNFIKNVLQTEEFNYRDVDGYLD